MGQGIGATVVGLTGTFATGSASAGFVSCGAFTSVAGSPAMTSFAGNFAGFAMDAAASEAVAAHITAITDTMRAMRWNTFAVTVVWCNAAESSGDVRWRTQYAVAGPGESINTPSTQVIATSTAGAQYVVVETVIDSAIAVPVAGKSFALKVGRLGADSLDTLANDAYLLGVRLTKTS